MNVETFIQKIKESEEYRQFTEEMYLEETSVTGMVAGYQTPKAFAPSKDDFEEHSEEVVKHQGYTVVPKGKSRNFESVYKQAMGALNEASYKEYRKDETRTTNRKINDSIKSINRISKKINELGA